MNLPLIWPNISFVKAKANLLFHCFPIEFIFSYGGKQDHLIDDKKDRHAKIFNNQAELLEAGYIDASGDDLKALTSVKKVGLIYH